jgi:hypothetical protein
MPVSRPALRAAMKLVIATVSSVEPSSTALYCSRVRNSRRCEGMRVSSGIGRRGVPTPMGSQGVHSWRRRQNFVSVRPGVVSP